MKNTVYVLILSILGFSPSFSQESDIYNTTLGSLKVTPILHGSLALQLNDITILVDPYGGAQLYESFSRPTLILITDIHGDHLNQKTLDGIDTSTTEFIVPKAVKEKLPTTYKSAILNNGQGVHREGIFIEAVPMYNLPNDETARHPKGRGNGYLLTIGNTTVYISGDTEDIQEMRMLRHVDIAFVCMNLPYTMSIDQAASAVLEFQPKTVYPFHYRGKEGLSDVATFKNMVESQSNSIEVKLREWYPQD